MKFQDQQVESLKRTEELEKGKQKIGGRSKIAQLKEDKEKTKKVEEGKAKPGAL